MLWRPRLQHGEHGSMMDARVLHVPDCFWDSAHMCLPPDGGTGYTAQNVSSSASCVEKSCNGAKLCSRRSTVTRRGAVEDELLRAPPAQTSPPLYAE